MTWLGRFVGRWLGGWLGTRGAADFGEAPDVRTSRPEFVGRLDTVDGRSRATAIERQPRLDLHASARLSMALAPPAFTSAEPRRTAHDHRESRATAPGGFSRATYAQASERAAARPTSDRQSTAATQGRLSISTHQDRVA